MTLPVHNPKRRSLATLLAAVLASFALALPMPVSAQNLAAGFGTLRLSGVAGGSVRAVRFGNTSDGFCTGWIGSSPNHTITLTQPISSMSIAVRAPSDTTLVILGPTGTRCNDDDGNNPNPRVSGAFAAGEYRIFVGSYEEGQNIRYSLEVSE